MFYSLPIYFSFRRLNSDKLVFLSYQDLNELDDDMYTEDPSEQQYPSTTIQISSSYVAAVDIVAATSPTKTAAAALLVKNNPSITNNIGTDSSDSLQIVTAASAISHSIATSSAALHDIFQAVAPPVIAHLPTDGSCVCVAGPITENAIPMPPVLTQNSPSIGASGDGIGTLIILVVVGVELVRSSIEYRHYTYVHAVSGVPSYRLPRQRSRTGQDVGSAVGMLSPPRLGGVRASPALSSITAVL